MWTVCRHQRVPLIWISRRTFTIHNLNKSIQRRAILEKVPYCDFSILRRKKNPVSEELQPHIMKITSINDYIRNVNDLYNTNRIRTFVRSKKNKFEAIFSILLHSLHYVCYSSNQMPKRFNKIAHGLPGEIQYILKSDQSTSNMVKRAQEFDPKFNDKISQLLNVYVYGDTNLKFEPETISGKLLTNVEISYAALLLTLEDKHDFQHILQWISSIVSQSITDSCHSLAGLLHFPNVIIKDILLRQPTSEYEFDLMFDFFQHYSQSTTVFSEVLIENMIRSANRYKFTRLEEVLKIILTKGSQIDDAMLNRLVCLLTDLGEIKNTREHYLSVLNAQRLLVDTILERKKSITPLGYLGIAHGLIPLSIDKAGKFLLFAMDQGLTTPEEHRLANIVKLKLSQTPESLIQTFDDTMADTSMSKDPEVWKELFMNLEKFALLNAENSNGFLKRLDDYSFSDAKTELLPHVSLDHLLKSTTTMSNRQLGTIIDKLYRSREHFEIFDEGYMYARHIFQNISSPTRSTVGTVLLGESFHNPGDAYDLYLRLLEEYCDGIPNEKCLLSLLIPPYNNTSLKWGNWFASQIAVHEFRKHCKRSLDDFEGTLIPSNALWKPYIKLLGRYNYQDQLGEIIKLWEDLKIVPERETLAILLASFPEGVGESKINHASRFLVHDSNIQEIQDVQDLSEPPNWDWPDDHELQFWRERITRRF